MNLFDTVTYYWNFDANKHDLGDDFVGEQVNALSNYELLKAISEALEEMKEQS